MPDISPDYLAELVSEHVKDADIDPGGISAIPVDPLLLTYRVGDYWVRVLKAEPKNPDFTPLHRDNLVCSMIDTFNRQTVDFSLHVPLPKPVVMLPASEQIDRPHQICHGIKGMPLLSVLRQGKLSSDEAKTLGKLTGRYLARVHSVQAKGAGMMTTIKTGVHPGPWQKYIQIMREAQWTRLKAGGPIDAGLVGRLEQLTEDRSKLMIGETTNLVHNDVNGSTFWVDEERKKVTGIVNFTKAGVGSSMVDMTMLYLNFTDTTFWDSVIEGYEAIRSLPDKFNERLAYYTVIFGTMSGWFFGMRKDEANKGYYMHKALKAAAELDGSFASDASKFGGFNEPKL